MEYGEEPHSAADSVQSPLEGDKGIVLKATWNYHLLEQLVIYCVGSRTTNLVWSARLTSSRMLSFLLTLPITLL
jgi:hypothetical protein